MENFVTSSVEDVPVLDTWARLEGDRKAVLVDVRTRAERAFVGMEGEIFFICRSGGRSRMAAEVMTAAGYRRCRNVAEGFEGLMDEDRHRGRTAGWKAAGLAWVQV